MSDATASIMSTHPEHKQTWMIKKESQSEKQQQDFQWEKTL